MKKRFFLLLMGSCLLAACTCASVPADDDPLKFTAQGEPRTLTMPDGRSVDYIAYEHIYYVTNVEDSTYQYLNYYVPQPSAGTASGAPILLRNYIGGYMASQAHGPSATDASGRALLEGYAVCIPGARGTNSTVTDARGNTLYTGRVPAGLLDLKAAVRYLRHNDALMPGNAEKIVSDGTSAGGAMSCLLGATGNHPLYEPLLEAMGAAKERDDIFAAVCYCPITDLDHADMAYEWLYSCTNKGIRHLTDDQCQVSEELAAQFPGYLDSLGLTLPDGTPLTHANYLDYIKSLLVRSVQRAVNEGCLIPDSIGIQMNTEPSWGPFPPRKGEFVVDIDMPRYLAYIVSTVPLKTPPAFDAQGVLDYPPSRENEAFGDNRGGASNFTAYSLARSTAGDGAVLPDDISLRARLMNPMYFIGEGAATTAPHWYIRHGARDRDTSFPVPVNLATKLQNNGYDVDFALPWNRPHSGDYNLDDLFCWMAGVTR